MAQVSYGSITVSDITDISDIYFEYCLVKSTTTIEDLRDINYFYNYFLSEDTSCEEGTLYFTRELVDGTYVYTEILEPTGNPSQLGYYEREQKDKQELDWSTTYPTWIEDYNIWTRQVHKLEGIDIPIYDEPYLDSAINQLSYSIKNHDISLNALETRTNHFWWNLLEENKNYPIGAYAAAGIDGIPFERDNYTTYGYNMSLQHNNIHFRFNEADLSSMGQAGINLYYAPSFVYKKTEDLSVVPSKAYYEKIVAENEEQQFEFYPVLNPNNEDINNYYELIIEDTKQKGLEITKEGLILYRPSDIISSNDYMLTEDELVVEGKDYYAKSTVNDEDIYTKVINPSGNPHEQNYYEIIFKNLQVVELNRSGLKIKDGSLYIGDSVNNPSSTASGSIALTQTDFARTIGGHDITNLRFAIGDSFGVTADGKVYINGAIHMGSTFDNIYTKEETDELQSNYLLISDAEDNYLNKTNTISDIQIIYIETALPIETLITNLPTIWITNTNTDVEQWTLTQPVYKNNDLSIYTAIQFKDMGENITTTQPTLGVADVNNLFINGQIDKDHLNLEGITINEFSGTIDSSHIDSEVIYNGIEQNVQGAINSTVSNYVSKNDLGNDAGLQKWQNLTEAIVIEPNTTGANNEIPPHISIISMNPTTHKLDPSSYLNLSGNTIQFVINNLSAPLIITPTTLTTVDAITDNIFAQALFMRAEGVSQEDKANRTRAFGWVVRADGHLGLKKF